MESIAENLAPEMLESCLKMAFDNCQIIKEGIYLINHEGVKILISDNGFSLECRVLINKICSYSQISEWNRNRRFSRCYVDSDGSVIFSFDCLTKNVNPLHFGHCLAILKNLIEELSSHFIPLEDPSDSTYLQSVVRSLTVDKFNKILDVIKNAPGVDIQDQGDMHYSVSFPLDPDDLQSPKHQALIRLSKRINNEFKSVDMVVRLKAEFNEETFKRMNNWNKKTRTSTIHFDSGIFTLLKSVGMNFGVTNYHIGRSIGDFLSIEAPEFMVFMLLGKGLLRSDLNE